jgi:starch phosphorylase
MQSHHYLPRHLPDALQDLATLALDLRWSWHHGADRLWLTVGGEFWQATRNPWLVLESVSEDRLRALAADRGFLEALRVQMAERKTYLASRTWFAQHYADRIDGQIAYFSMEFGLDEALPIYSGGLGVLAGDCLKTGCDLGVPLVGLGLLYQRGYFRQKLNAHGEQIEFFPVNDPTMLPLVPLRDASGAWVRVALELPGRTLLLRTWHGQVGRRSLLLLDSNHPLNDPVDRGITGELYGGDPEVRLQQELVLGVGGWRLLEQLGIECRVCHLNEGHAAFAVLERARHFMHRHATSFREALRATRAGNLFTTHTPVAAGFDQFSPELIRQYLAGYAASLGLDVAELLALGRRVADGDGEPFNMALLAVRGSGAVNGVSRLHGEVSRRIFQPLFPRWPRADIPVEHVTNGVHVPTWDSLDADALWTRWCGKDRWRGALQDLGQQLTAVSDAELWQFRMAGRQRLVQFLRQRVARQHVGRGGAAAALAGSLELLDPDALTIGFARRMTEYKRTTLLLADPDRLQRLLSNRDRPVQIVFAGKAHPLDHDGKYMLQQWQEFMARADVDGRVVFIEDYDLVVAGELTQGVDVWINTPRRPWEASGTSGMKVLVNGGINLSSLDGWWAEAHAPEVGWSIGDGAEHAETQLWDERDAAQLLDVLERDVVPAFYQRDAAGVPRAWVARVRASMSRLTAQFSSNRMLREYVERFYLPLAERSRERSAARARELEAQYRMLAEHWDQLHFGNVGCRAADGVLQFEVQVYLGELAPQSVRVEIYAEGRSGEPPVRQELRRGDCLMGATNAYCYQGTVPATRPQEHYTPRIIAADDGLCVPLEADFITWYR